MIKALHLEVYQINSFNASLSHFGVVELPPRHPYEVFHGSIGGGEISVNLSGEVNYPSYPRVVEAVAYAKQSLTHDELIYQRYVVIAQHTRLSKELERHRHLNVWLNLDQYYAAIKRLENDPRVTQLHSGREYVERMFEQSGHRIEFHTNGKVISENGYTVFAPLLRTVLLDFNPFNTYDLIIGQDEVGNGEKIGPLVLGSVALDPMQMVELQLAGIKDSKLVPHKVAVGMSAWIRRNSHMNKLLQLNPLDLNRMDQSMVDILRWGHTKVANDMLSYLRRDDTVRKKKILLVIDQFHHTMDLSFDLKGLPNVDVQYIPSGEQYCTSVAAASILVKAKRYRWRLYHEKIYDVILKRKYLNYLRRHHAAQYLLRP